MRRRGLGALSLAPMALALDPFLEIADASLAVDEAGGIKHFLFVPAGGVREVQLRLAAWGRPKMTPNSLEQYGYDGPLFPGDFADMNHADDLDGVDSHRTGLAIGSFQRWWNKANAVAGNPLRVDNMYDLATHNALVSVSGGALTPNAPAALPSPNSVVIAPSALPVPGGFLPGSAEPPGTPAGALPPSLPGSIFPAPSGGADSDKQTNWIAYALIAAGVALGLYVIVVVSRKRRKKAA
jgi:hypothetical protein